MTCNSLRRLTIALAVTAAAASVAFAAEPLGQRPSFMTRALTELPNAQAIVAQIWAPGLDDGYVPQGLTIQGDTLVMGAYRSTDTAQDRGPCRVFFIDRKSGAVKETLDLPSSCGHAGGAAALADGRLVIADTRIIFIIDQKRSIRSVRLGGALRGSFADADAGHLWLGVYGRSPGSVWRVPLEALKKDVIDESDVNLTIPVAARAQGLVIDGKGGGWVTVSGSEDGALLRIDAATGQLLARYDMPPGIEDLAIDERGLIWAVSESGSQRWSKWRSNHPILFAIDPSKLK